MCDACAIIAFEGASLGVICICLETLAWVSATPMQGSLRYPCKGLRGSPSKGLFLPLVWVPLASPFGLGGKGHRTKEGMDFVVPRDTCRDRRAELRGNPCQM